jgi:hypothetical protein
MRILPIVCSALLASALALAANSPLPAARQAYGQLPTWFEPSRDGASFLSRGSSVELRVDAQGASVASPHAATRMSFVGARRTSQLDGVDRQPAISSYMVGKRANWRAGVEHYGRVAAREVYPGIDVIYYSIAKTLEYDMVVRPGADPKQVRLRFSGQQPRIEPDGSLLLAGGVRQLAPQAYQEVNGHRVAVDSHYRLASNGEVRVELGRYDRRRELVIDPEMSYAGYIGATDNDYLRAACESADGGFWLVGSVTSTDWEYILKNETGQSTMTYYYQLLSAKDAFLAKINKVNGVWTLTYFTYFGGSGDDEAVDVKLWKSYVAIVGNTSSADFPFTDNAVQTEVAGTTDTFVTVFNPAVPTTGTDNTDLYNKTKTIIYSTVFGGTKADYATSMALGSDFIAVGGYTLSGDIDKMISGYSLQPENRGVTDGLLYAVYPENQENSFLYATYFGGAEADTILKVAVDSQDNIYAVGQTFSDDLPISDTATYSSQISYGDGFILKIDPHKMLFDSFLYASYLGGSGTDSALALAVESPNIVWVSGYTMSEDLPVTPGAYQSSLRGEVNAYLMRLDLTQRGTNFIKLCTYFGGSGGEVPYAMAWDPKSKTVTAVGYTTSPDFPIKGFDAWTRPTVVLSDTFVARFNGVLTGDSQLVFSLAFGGEGHDVANNVFIDSTGGVFVTGNTGSYFLNRVIETGKPSIAAKNSGLFYRIQP